MGPGALGIGMGLATGVLSGISAKKQTERNNRMLQARQIMLEKEMVYRRSMFRVNTFSEFYDSQEAGAAKINSVLSQGTEAKGTGSILQQHHAGFERNKYMREYSLRFQESQVRDQQGILEGQKESRWGAATQAFLATGLSQGVSWYGAAGGDFGSEK